jgi:hypothetical protein
VTRAAEERPAHFVAFDLLRLSGTDTTSWSYRRRRATLGSLFVARRLSAPSALCPSTTAAVVVREWLRWASVGMEGVVYKRLDSVCCSAGTTRPQGRHAWVPSMAGCGKRRHRRLRRSSGGRAKVMDSSVVVMVSTSP